MSFEDNIRKWIQIDNTIKEKQLSIKQLKVEKEQYNENILEYLSENNLENATIKIGDGKLRLVENNTPQALTFKFICESLCEYFQDDEDPTTGVKRKKNQEIDLFSDGTLTVMNNLNIPKFHVKFEGLFPYSLSSLQFDATQADLDYFTAQVSFKYNIYNIETIE